MRRNALSGFTLIENLVAVAMIALFGSIALVSVTQFNRFAAATRMQTVALAVAQQQIDEVLTVPWNRIKGRPSLLNAGVLTENGMVLNNDRTVTTANGGSAFSDLDLEVPATRTTTVADITSRQLRATVEVAYKFRGKPFQVSLTTLRTMDTF